MAFQVEDEVIVTVGHGHNERDVGGTIRFVGRTKFAPGTWLGICLDEPCGRNDGSVNGEEYFSCDAQHGLFLKIHATSVRRAPSALEAERIRGRDAYYQRHGGAPRSPRRERREAAAAVRLQSNFRGMKERSLARVKQRIDAWDELDMADEVDFLQKHRDNASVARYAAQLGATDPNEKPSKLARLTSARMWVEAADRAPADPPAHYRGPRPAWPLTDKDVRLMIDHFRREPQVPLYESCAVAILATVKRRLEDSYGGAVQDLEVPKGEDAKFIVVGDTHGQLKDFLWILMEQGLPSPTTTYLINGDVADRGANAVEIFLLIFALKLIHPHAIFFNRGNHEMEEMNCRDGGFMHEVQRKYNGRVFRLFSRVFELWPIAAVLGGRVIILHGGIPRQRGVSLHLLRNVACRRQVPQDPRNDEDQLFFDCLWNDPHEGNGLATSSRGDGCVAFGRDICRAFLKRSDLGMLVRSHECPRERGFVEHHGGRTFTVFSASNYCGSMGNLGAVMIFNERMEFIPWEYMAPSLEEQEEMHAQGAVEAADARGLERVASVENAARQAQTMDDMIVAKLKQLIVERRTDLWWYYHHSEKSARTKSQHLAGSIRKHDDPGLPIADGHISPIVWRDGLVSVLQLQSVPIMTYRPQLVELQPDGSIDYNRFLNRYVLVQDDESHSGWQADVVKELYEAVLKSDLSLRETFAFFDHNGDGRVTFEEFVSVCNECELGITPHQAKQLLREIAHSSDGRGVDIADFIERFQVLYVGSSGNRLLDKVTEPWASELISKVGRAIVGGGESATDVFRQFDKDNSGFLEYEEFAEAVRVLEAGPDASPGARRQSSGGTPLGPSVVCGTPSCLNAASLKLVPADEWTWSLTQDDQLQQLARMVDLEGNGRVNIWQFVAAFVAHDAGTHSVTSLPSAAGYAQGPEEMLQHDTSAAGQKLGRQLSHGVVQAVAGTIFSHRSVLRKAWLVWDDDADGVVTVPAFRAGLKSVNILLDAPMTPQQLEALVTHAARCNRRGAPEMINYEGFLQSFDVVDVEQDSHGRADAQAELTSTTSLQRAQSNAAAAVAAAAAAAR